MCCLISWFHRFRVWKNGVYTTSDKQPKSWKCMKSELHYLWSSWPNPFTMYKTPLLTFYCYLPVSFPHLFLDILLLLVRFYLWAHQVNATWTLNSKQNFHLSFTTFGSLFMLVSSLSHVSSLIIFYAVSFCDSVVSFKLKVTS